MQHALKIFPVKVDARCTRTYQFHTISLAKVSCATTFANTAESLSLDVTKLFATNSGFRGTWRRFTTTILAFWTRDTLRKTPTLEKEQYMRYEIPLRVSIRYLTRFCHAHLWVIELNKEKKFHLYVQECIFVYHNETSWAFPQKIIAILYVSSYGFFLLLGWKSLQNTAVPNISL